MKTMWRFLSTDSIWSKICFDKYLRDMTKEDWILGGHKSRGIASPIWNGLLEMRQWISPGFIWQVGSGTDILIGEAPIIGGDNGLLSTPLVAYFRHKGYKTLEHFCSHSTTFSGYWRDSHYFRLSGAWKGQRDSFVASLLRMGITLQQKEDILLWSYNPSIGAVTSHLAYLHLLSRDDHGIGTWWAYQIWRWSLPLKIKCFYWLLLHHRVLTWENLCRRGW